MVESRNYIIMGDEWSMYTIACAITACIVEVIE